MPCYSSITDLAGLQFWAHPGIDLHFITHPESAEEVERIAGPGSVRWAKPPTSPAFLAARSRADARRALGLPGRGPGDRRLRRRLGGRRPGRRHRAPRCEFKDATVLCLCGRNDQLRAKVSERFAGEPRLRIMGFTDRMGDVLAAADVLVHSSAGLTVLEAIIRGCPVVSYGFGYGHVRASNAALERFKLAQVAQQRARARTARSSARSTQHAGARRPLRPPPADRVADPAPTGAASARCRRGACAPRALRPRPPPRWRLPAGRSRPARRTRWSRTSPTSAR